MQTFEVDLVLSMGGIDITSFDRESLKSREQLAKEITDKEVRLRYNPALRQIFRSARSVRFLIRSQGMFLLETGRGYPKDGTMVLRPGLQPHTGTETRLPDELANATAVRGIAEEGKELPPGAIVQVVYASEVRNLHWSRVYHKIASAVHTVCVDVEIPDPAWWPQDTPFTDTDGVESYPEWFDHWPFPLPFGQWPLANEAWPPNT